MRSVFLLHLCFILPGAFVSQSFAQATPLSELALFHRCYTQITSLRAKSSDPLTQQVAAGTRTAVDACMNIFSSAQLNGANLVTLANPNDARAVSVLATFHRLHASWFSAKDFPVISWPGHAGDMKDLYDSTSPALYYTRALFGAGYKASDPVTTNDFLRAERTTSSPNVGPESGHPKTDFIFTTPFSFAAVGALTGIEAATNLSVSYPASPGGQGTAGSISLYTNWGGGFLGTQAYLNLNLPALSSYVRYRTDGAGKMHRRYGKAVFHDALCRELPVVRESDALPFVNPASPMGFRTSASCAKCHVSHDRVSGVVRGMFVSYIGTGDPTAIGAVERGGSFADFHEVTRTAETSWPSSPDNDYYRRPANGHLFLRDYKGVLIDQQISSVGDLGEKISQLDDYYICLAKRYYQYFTGITVDTGDIGDPARFTPLSPNDADHRAVVVNLGKSLKSNQSLPQLIRSILSLENYKKPDFGARK